MPSGSLTLGGPGMLRLLLASRSNKIIRQTELEGLAKN